MVETIGASTNTDGKTSTFRLQSKHPTSCSVLSREVGDYHCALYTGAWSVSGWKPKNTDYHLCVWTKWQTSVNRQAFSFFTQITKNSFIFPQQIKNGLKKKRKVLIVTIPCPRQTLAMLRSGQFCCNIVFLPVSCFPKHAVQISLSCFIDKSRAWKQGCQVITIV